MTPAELCEAWGKAKAAEAAAIEHRRKIEDEIIGWLGVSDGLDGTESHEVDGYVLKITGRMNRKVDSDRLQEIAAEHDLSGHLGSLFRWKPELNLAAWKNAASTITAPLAAAITTTPGRPSVAITHKES